jgi:hypothetical protein
MNKKKIFLSILLVVLIGLIFTLYNAFNGNPVSKYITKQALETYLEETYPEKEFTIKKGMYDFKWASYYYRVVEIGNAAEYEYRVKGFIKPEIMYDGIHQEYLDVTLSERLSKQARLEISPLLTSQVRYIQDVGISLEVLKGKYDSNVTWNKDLQVDKAMRITVKFNSTNQSEDDFYHAAKNVKKILDEHGYRYDAINFNGNGYDTDGGKATTHGYLKFSLFVNKNEDVSEGKIESHNEDMWE